MKKELFGRMPDGCEVHAYTLKNGKMEARILDLGGILSRLSVNGQNVILGFDTLEGVLEDTSYQGSLVGRYGNRIHNARFVIDGKEYKLYANTAKVNHLHGGKYGFNRKLWRAEPFGESELALFYRSPDGEEGYPGNLDVRVTYKLLPDALEIRYEAISDKDTFVNLTNHVYFNLDGASTEGDILGHTLQIHADTYTDVDKDLIPVGRKNVENTRFDFRTAKRSAATSTARICPTPTTATTTTSTSTAGSARRWTDATSRWAPPSPTAGSPWTSSPICRACSAIPPGSSRTPKTRSPAA